MGNSIVHRMLPHARALPKRMGAAVDDSFAFRTFEPMQHGGNGTTSVSHGYSNIIDDEEIRLLSSKTMADASSAGFPVNGSTECMRYTRYSIARMEPQGVDHGTA
jgi:hypothetical protein